MGRDGSGRMVLLERDGMFLGEERGACVLGGRWEIISKY